MRCFGRKLTFVLAAVHNLAAALATCEIIETVVVEFCVPQKPEPGQKRLARIVEEWVKNVPKTCVTIGIRITLLDEDMEADWEAHARALWQGWVDVGRTLHAMPQLKALYIDLPSGADVDMKCQWSKSLVASVVRAIWGVRVELEANRLYGEYLQSRAEHSILYAC